jgi:hypothetical protein
LKGNGNAGNYYHAVHRVQGAQLLDDEEQEDHYGSSRDEEVLQALPQAPNAQGSEVEKNRDQGTGIRDQFEPCRASLGGTRKERQADP